MDQARQVILNRGMPVHVTALLEAMEVNRSRKSRVPCEFASSLCKTWRDL